MAIPPFQRLEMMDERAYSFARANAHPALAARLLPGSRQHRESGVVRTIRSALGMG